MIKSFSLKILVMDWSSSSLCSNSNPNQIIQNMARELEESTVGPLQNSFPLLSNKNLLRYEFVSLVDHHDIDVSLM